MTANELGESAATLDALADTAAATYYDTMTKFGLAKYPRNGVRKSRNWSKFMKLARVCMAHDVPIDKLVTAAILQTMERHSIVTVQDVLNFDYHQILKGTNDGNTGSSTPQDLWNLLSCKLLDMVFSLDGVKDKNDLLDSTMYGFPAWFRVFSPHEPVQRIIVHWGDLAYEELTEDLRLNEFLKNKRPNTYSLLKSVMEKI